MDLNFNGVDTGYKHILTMLMEHGKDYNSRVGKVREIEDFRVTFQDPTRSIMPYRPKFSPLLGLMEGVQLISGRARPALMDKIWPTMPNFTDHWGDYGARAAKGDQMWEVYNALKTDPDTRRAIITLWDPTLDSSGGHKDHPCTLSIGFRVRDGKLNMSVTMRSNDIWRGASSDFIQFALLQITFAAGLGLKVGTYTHTAYSMHLYHSDFAVATDWLESYNGRLYHEYALLPLATEGMNYAQLAGEAAETIASATREEDLKTPMGLLINKRFKQRRDQILLAEENA